MNIIAKAKTAVDVAHVIINPKILFKQSKTARLNENLEKMLAEHRDELRRTYPIRVQSTRL